MEARLITRLAKYMYNNAEYRRPYFWDFLEAIKALDKVFQVWKIFILKVTLRKMVLKTEGLTFVPFKTESISFLAPLFQLFLMDPQSLTKYLEWFNIVSFHHKWNGSISLSTETEVLVASQIAQRLKAKGLRKWGFFGKTECRYSQPSNFSIFCRGKENAEITIWKYILPRPFLGNAFAKAEFYSKSLSFCRGNLGKNLRKVNL